MQLLVPQEFPEANNLDLLNLEKIDELYKLLSTCAQEDHLEYLTCVQLNLPYRFYVVRYDIGYLGFVNCEYEPATNEKLIIKEKCSSTNHIADKLRYKEIILDGFIYWTRFINLIQIEKMVENPKFIGLHCHSIDHQENRSL